MVLYCDFCCLLPSALCSLNRDCSVSKITAIIVITVLLHASHVVCLYVQHMLCIVCDIQNIQGFDKQHNRGDRDWASGYNHVRQKS